MLHSCANRKGSLPPIGNDTSPPFLLTRPFLPASVLKHQHRGSKLKHWRSLHIWKFGDTDFSKSYFQHNCICSFSLYSYHFPIEITQNRCPQYLLSCLQNKPEPWELYIHTKQNLKKIKGTEKYDKIAIENSNPIICHTHTKANIRNLRFPEMFYFY